jgi:predicted DNA-binding protein (MmcQ/YjbR family)
MSKQVNPLARIRNFCLQFPDSKEVIQFGHPFFKWRDKPFAVLDDNDISIKVEKESQPLFLEDPRFTKTPYIGNHGWITLSLSPPINWEEVEELIRGSYEFVSTKKAKKRQN